MIVIHSKHLGIFALMLLFILPSILIVSCHDKEEPEPEPVVVGHRTVVAYMIGNTLTSQIMNNINDMIKGSVGLTSDDNLLIYVDMPSEPSYIIKAEQGKADTVKIYDEDRISVDPVVLSDVLTWCYSTYPSKTYGLVFATHGEGWIISNDSVAVTRSKNEWVGYDTGKISLNIPSLAEALTNIPHLDFILWDCCNMQCIEVAYELRKNADYFLGSPAEIPGNGAPYETIVPLMFSYTDNYAGQIIDTYFETYAAKNDSVPMSVINSEYLEELAAITAEKLQKKSPKYPNSLNPSEVIFYFRENGLEFMYDMNDVMLKNFSSADYAEWKAVFDKVVTHLHRCSKWITQRMYQNDFYTFEVNDNTYGGASMFFPQENYKYWKIYDYNSDYHKMSWYWKMNWGALGW